MRTVFTLFCLLACPVPAFASPVISEVMWMGTDLSTSDEWLEIHNPESDDIDLSGWSVTSVNSSAKEIVSLRFQTGTVIAAGEYLVLASKSAASSRLLADPFTVSSALSLPNTKLLLRLRDAENAVIDEVDDGVGSPFAGDNPSGTGAKASMQRIDPLALGNLKSNWMTSTTSAGFDEGSRSFGTPGLPSDIEPELEPDPPSADPQEIATCVDPLEIAIAVQSGPLIAVGKATVNFQAVATLGSLSGVVCSWSYGDGFSSTSCNPPVHSFVGAGIYSVRLEAKNQCDTTLQQEQIVQVLPDPTVAQTSSAQAVWYDGSRLVFKGALPNPTGTDTGKEWIEIKNLEQKAVDLRGWKLAVGETSIQSYLLKDSIGPNSTLRLYDSELKFKLPNTMTKIQLIAPNGVALSTIPWKSADDDRTYFPDDIRSLTVRGRVLKVTGPTIFIMELDGDAAASIGSETVTVRIPNADVNPVMNVKENPIEYLRALIENKYIELQFGTDTWDEVGRLVSDAIIDGNTLVSQRMYMSKIWIQTSALNENDNDDFTIGNSMLKSEHVRVGDVFISEVYPSPFPKQKDGSESDWKNQEWLELENTTQRAIDLSGWKIATSKSEKALPEGLKISSGSKIVIYTASVGLGLRNAGDALSLMSPEDMLIASLAYSEMKNGMSFTFNKDASCITIQPTPGATNTCVQPITKTRSAIAKSVAAKKSTAKVKAYAASYRAQSDSDTHEQEPIVFHNEPTSTSWASLALALAMGMGISMTFGFLMASNGILGQFKNSDKILNKL